MDVDGELQHEGTTVLVFHKDGFFRVLPNVRSTSGKNQLIFKKSSYRLRGDRLVVLQGLSFTNPMPQQTYLVQRIGEGA